MQIMMVANAISTKQSLVSKKVPNIEDNHDTSPLCSWKKKKKKNLEILAFWISYSFVHLHNKAPKTKVVEERNIVASAHPIPWSLYQHAISTNIHTHAFTLKKKHVHTHTCGCAHAYTKHVYSPIFARTHTKIHITHVLYILVHTQTLNPTIQQSPSR